MCSAHIPDAQRTHSGCAVYLGASLPVFLTNACSSAPIPMSNIRLLHLLIIAAASLGIATACFYLGGVIAEAASSTPIMGITFKAGGALAGFIITFLLLYQAYMNFVRVVLVHKVAIIAAANPFVKAGKKYTAKASLLHMTTGNRRDRDADVIWDAGVLTVLLREIENDHMVQVCITDGNGGTWESDSFSPLWTKITL